mgnify:CR=1 FL=1
MKLLRKLYFFIISFIDDLFNKGSWIPTELNIEKYGNPDQQDFRLFESRDKNIANILYYVIGLFILYYLAKFHSDQDWINAWGYNIRIEIFFSVLLLIIIIIPIKNLNKKSPRLILNNSGILKDGKLILWEKIVGTYIETMYDESSKYFNLVIKTKERKYRLNINNLKNDKDYISHITEYFRLKYGSA